uniref:Uncharacterized protein n=1 Tax=Romanomermis culicivorax TaxID=13658 RepID=A0A915I1L0_ROMCU
MMMQWTSTMPEQCGPPEPPGSYVCGSGSYVGDCWWLQKSSTSSREEEGKEGKKKKRRKEKRRGEKEE